MSRQLPKNRRPLRAAAFALIPVYLVLWVAGTGCIHESELRDSKLARCLFVLDLIWDSDLTDLEVLDILWGVALEVPPSALTGSGSSTMASMGTVTLSQRRGGELVKSIDQQINIATMTESLFSSGAALEGLDIQPNDRLALYVALQTAVRDLFASIKTEEDSAFRAPTFRFPAPASRVKFSMLFDATFGIGYDFPAGELVFNGSAEVSEGARAKVPKKVIVEVAHLDSNGKVKSKHKQVVKIKNNGDFKTSRKAFKGFDVAEGERVRVRLKPKKGDLTGVDWTLKPTYNFSS